MKTLRTAIAGILTLLATASAFGQGGIGNFPQTVPAQTVVGRLGIVPGPTQAIPISQLAAAFGATRSVTVNARCDGATDDTAAINADLAQGGYWTLPPNKTCAVTQLNITVSGTRLSGGGFNSSILKGTTAGVPTINVSASLENVYLDGFQVTKSVTATSGGTGIKMNGDCQYCVLDGIFVQKHYVGIQLQSTGVGYLRRILSQYNISDGIALTNSSVSGTLQWDFNDIYSGQNGGRGYIAASGVNGSILGITLGSWHNVRTFANSGVGIGIVGTAAMPINGVRITKGFLGQDGNHEIYLDTYGGLHTIADTYLELAGTGATGPTLATAASNTGDGLRITANNTDVTVDGSYITGNYDSGINTSATVVTSVNATHINLHGVYGINSANCALVTGTGLFFANNTSANINCGSNNGAQIIVGSLPAAANTFATQAGLSVLGVAGTASTTPAAITGTANQILSVNSAGTSLAFRTMSGDCTLLSGAITCLSSNGVANRIRLSGTLAMYVRTDGNNTNCTGLTNAAYVSGSYPQNCGFATIQKAYDVLADGYDVAGYTATINVGNGTYTSGLLTSKCVPGQNGPGGVRIIGSATPSNVLFSVTSDDIFSLGATAAGAGKTGCTQITIGGMKLQTTTAGNAINISGGGVGITFGESGFPIEFGAAAQDHIVANHSAWAIAGTGYTISGSAVIHVAAISNAVVAIHNVAVTTSGTPAFTYFAYADTNGSVFANATYGGTGATGARYFAGNGGMIYTNSSSSTFIPGNSSGVEFMGGKYIGAGATLPSGYQLFTSGVQTYQTPGIMRTCVTGVNFNSANTDNAINLTLPTTTYAIFRIYLSNPSASLSTATLGIYGSTGGGGTVIVSNAAITVTSTSANTINNMMTVFAGSASTSYNHSTIYARVGTAQGSAATGDVCVYYYPLT